MTHGKNYFVAVLKGWIHVYDSRQNSILNCYFGNEIELYISLVLIPTHPPLSLSLYFYNFLASYLPKPSSQEYEFVYIDGKGEVCSCSSKFTFCAPKPLDELVTLEEDLHEEEEGTGMLLVIPRADLLQVSTRNKDDFSLNNGKHCSVWHLPLGHVTNASVTLCSHCILCFYFHPS